MYEDASSQPSRTAGIQMYEDGGGPRSRHDGARYFEEGFGQRVRDEGTTTSSPAVLPSIRNGRPSGQNSPEPFCHLCQCSHNIGSCQLQIKGAEYCRLCGVAHFSLSQKCLHFCSDIQIRLMLDSLRTSKEPKPQIDAVREVLRRELAKKTRGKQHRPHPGN